VDQACWSEPDSFIFPSRVTTSPHLGTRQYARIVDGWVKEIGLDPAAYGTHSMRRTKASLIYRRTKNLRATYTSLFPEDQDAKSPSWGFDAAFGYNNTRMMMTDAEIEKAIDDFAHAAERVRASGADGLEITASKGYLIHQFLNPGFNRRRDRWGGSADKRFHFLERTLAAVRARRGAPPRAGLFP